MAELNLSSGKSGGRQTSKLPVRVDLTALVDLAFLLITFFMLTTTLARSRAMSLVMPDKCAGGMAVPESSTMTICLGKGQAMWYLGMADKPVIAPKVTAYGNDLNKAILELRKQVKATSGRDMMVIIKPSAHSVYNNLVSTIDELNITQTNRYAIVDIAAKDIALLKQKGIY
ncbi:outer membrane transport energization protein ExbD [Mucilaginibacter mallensis]|uniref:Outer membrane transport energization protein ExbD n=1 Tax=Mucilaginibacter mallensis TaxID=652787 RepID=A0A1H2A422_MUCMA|nr:biopolymer transporter ExbD [Mucilaginibacter mallensis]SDT40643.1 outer membrane transport energization protein ExbD [Mucilaginibacter mallensis]